MNLKPLLHRIEQLEAQHSPQPQETPLDRSLFSDVELQHIQRMHDLMNEAEAQHQRELVEGSNPHAQYENFCWHLTRDERDYCWAVACMMDERRGSRPCQHKSIVSLSRKLGYEY